MNIAEAEAAAKAKAEENVALVQKFNDAFITGETEIWREICAEDFVTLGPGIESELTLEEYIENIAGLHEAALFHPDTSSDSKMVSLYSGDGYDDNRYYRSTT